MRGYDASYFRDYPPDGRRDELLARAKYCRGILLNSTDTYLTLSTLSCLPRFVREVVRYDDDSSYILDRISAWYRLSPAGFNYEYGKFCSRTGLYGTPEEFLVILPLIMGFTCHESIEIAETYLNGRISYLFNYFRDGTRQFSSSTTN